MLERTVQASTELPPNRVNSPAELFSTEWSRQHHVLDNGAVTMVRLVYFSATAMFILGAITFTAYGAVDRFSSDARRYGYAAVTAAGAMCLGYLGMTTIQALFEQRGLPLLLMELSRFIGYTFLWLPVVYVATAVAGASRRLSVAIFASISGQLWLTFCAWKVPVVPQQLVLVSPFVLAAGLALLYLPLTRVARQQSPERTILYNKLKHIMAIGWFGQVMTVVVHPSTLGWTTVFTDWVTIMYVELILVGAFVMVVLSNAETFETVSTPTVQSSGESRPPEVGA